MSPRRTLDRMPCPRCGRDTAYWFTVGRLSVREFRDHNDPATREKCLWWKGAKT